MGRAEMELTVGVMRYRTPDAFVLICTAVMSILLGICSLSYASPRHNALACLSNQDIRDLKSADNEKEIGEKTLKLFARCKGEIFGKKIPASVSAGLTHKQQMVIFTTVLSHISAPYGGCNEMDLIPLLRATELNCASYVLLAAQLFENAVGQHRGELIFVGFNGGAVGNHSQMIYQTSAGSLLLDPMVGIAAMIGYDELLSGRKLPLRSIISFYAHGDEMQEFYQTVRKTLTQGLYRPSDVLYYYAGTEMYRNAFRNARQPDSLAYVKSLATPGAVSLYRQLSESDFFRDEFRNPQSLRELCRRMQKDRYDGMETIRCEEAKEYAIIFWLNRTIRLPHFFTSWEKKKKISLPRDAELLVQDTQDFRRISVTLMPDDKREKTIRLNRKLLEITYPGVCPRKALIGRE